MCGEYNVGMTEVSSEPSGKCKGSTPLGCESVLQSHPARPELSYAEVAPIDKNRPESCLDAGAGKH